MKATKKQGWLYRTSVKVELLLGAVFFSLLGDSAAPERTISLIHTTHNSIIGFDASKGSFNPQE